MQTQRRPFSRLHFEERNHDRTGAYQLNDSGEGAESFHMLKFSLGVDPNKIWRAFSKPFFTIFAHANGYN